MIQLPFDILFCASKKVVLRQSLPDSVNPMEPAPEVLLANASAESTETPSISIRSARNRGWPILLFLIVSNVLGRVVLDFSSLASLVGITKHQK